VANEEALLVVIRVDEPQRDRIGAAGFDLAGLRLEYVDAVDLNPDVVCADRLDVDVRFAENAVLCSMRHQSGARRGPENMRITNLGGDIGSRGAPWGR
jgi:hypothetical protein